MGSLCSCCPACRCRAYCPDSGRSFCFLQSNAVRGPAVAQSLFQQMLWWRSHVGVPFPANDPLLAIWNRPAANHRSVQHEPLPVSIVFQLSKIATGACPIAGAFAGFSLLPLAACLRFAHVQRSVDLQLRGPFLFGLCTRGKSREQRVRKPFEWACPHSFLGCIQFFVMPCSWSMI